MTLHRLADYLDHMRQAIVDAQSFTEGMTQADFEQDNWARAQRFEPLERIQGADRD